MNIIDVQNYFSPRSRVRSRAISFAEMLRQRHEVQDDDIVFAHGTSQENYRFTLIRKGKIWSLRFISTASLNVLDQAAPIWA